MSKSFTLREVDALIPKLEGVFQHMDVCRKRVHELASAYPRANDLPSAASDAESTRLRSRVEFLLQAVQDDIAHVARFGGRVTDVEQGLVDFLGRVQGEDVWLCWKRGEQKIHFWHPLYSGYSERQTLKRSGARPTTRH